MRNAPNRLALVSGTSSLAPSPSTHRARAARAPEYPCWSSGVWGRRGAFSEEGIGENDEVSHDGDDGDLWGLAGGGESLEDAPEIGIEADCDERRHEEGVAHFGPSATDETFAAPLSAVASHGRQASEAGGACVFDRAEFGHVGEQGEG